MQTKYKVVFLLVLLLPLVTTPVGMNVDNNNTRQIETNLVSQAPDAYYIQDVPYVWQEVNGYCMSAALSMVLQSMGMDIGLYDLFVTMGTGFSAVYMGIDESRNFFPGIFIRQPAYLKFFCDLYGLELTGYMDTTEPYGQYAANVFTGHGVEFQDYANESVDSQFDVIRNSISSGIPLVVAVDLFYLPPDDYDVFRQYGAPLNPGDTSHAITIVGYNDTSQEIYIQDPGVGLFEPNNGYPDDGRWNYTMSYLDFDAAWRSAGYLTFRVASGSGPVDDFEERLGAYICKRLRGDRTSYFEGFENYFFLSPGKTAFSGLGLDLTVDSISDYARYFLEVNKAAALLRLGHILELTLTIHYYCFYYALNSIQDIFPDVDLTEFIDTADDALPHFELLKSNISLRSAVGIDARDTLLYNTFKGISEDFQLSGDLEGSISQHQEQLDEIRGHLFAIADAWNTAADALEIALNLPDEVASPGDSMLVVIGGSGLIVLVVAIYLYRRRK